MKKYVLILVVSIGILGSSIPAQSQNESKYSNNFNTAVPISVTIGGEFIVTGSFPAFSGERVDQYVTRVYNEVKSQIPYPNNNDELFVKTVQQTDKYALRGITIKSKDVSEKKVDLLRFRLNGDFENNPYLKNDDVLIFPAYDLEYNFVEVSGAVNKQLKFQFIDGDKLSDAIFFARGLNKAYESVDSAVISRLSYDGRSEQTIRVLISDDAALKRGDRVRVIANQTNRKDYKVLILGEVYNPGYIYITKDNTTLKEVISKAGGYTPNASLKDAQVIRNYNREQILKKYAIEKKAEKDPSELLFEPELETWRALETLKMYRALDMHHEDTLFFNFSNELRILEGTNLVDFTGLDSANSSESGFIVKESDIIIVPEKLEAVYVFGQVSTPGYYKYSPNQKCEYYIDKAGGFTNGAEKDEVFVIKGTSREWISFEDKYTLEPGDYIYVVKNIRRDFWYWVYQIGTLTSILGTVATILLIVLNNRSSSGI